LGYRVQINFSISLDASNQHLLWMVWKYFGCGGVGKGGRKMAKYQTGSLDDAINIIIPFFEMYPLLGNKSLDFEDYRKVAFMMRDGLHLTPQGLE